MIDQNVGLTDVLIRIVYIWMFYVLHTYYSKLYNRKKRERCLIVALATDFNAIRQGIPFQTCTTLYSQYYKDIFN